MIAFAFALGACGDNNAPSTPSGGGSAGSAGSGSSQGGSGGAAQGGSGGKSAGGSGGNAGATAGSAGSAGSGGSAGMPTGPVRSAGCGKVGPVTGERQMDVAGMTGLYIVSIPTAYDPDQAYPLGFGFHGRNRNHANCRDGDCAGFQTVMGEQAVLVYMQSLRTPTDNLEGGWEAEEEREGNADFFEAVLALVKSEFCVDERRVFAAGTSSGASFSNLLGCRFGDQLLAVGPVSGWMPETANCVGTPAAVVIHGIDDPHVTFESGEVARDFYVAQNGCSDTTEPPLATMHADIRQKRDAMPTVEDDGCVDYQGCTAAPVRWCEHSYGGYDLSTHGWPPTGGQLIWDFVSALP